MGKFTPKAGFDGKSVDGTVVSSNKNGAILRGRGIPIISSSPKASVWKNNFSAAAHFWNTLTSTQKDVFNATTINGRTGYELFMYVNIPRRLFGLGFRKTPPDTFGATDYGVTALSSGSGNLEIQVVTDYTGDFNGLVIYASAPKLEIDFSLPLNEYRIIAVLNPISATYVDVYDAYIAAYGDYEQMSGYYLQFSCPLFKLPGAYPYGQQYTAFFIP